MFYCTTKGSQTLTDILTSLASLYLMLVKTSNVLIAVGGISQV